MKLAVLDFLGHIDPDSIGAVMDARSWEPQPGILEAIALLHHNGWHVVQATNQPGLGRGSLEINELNALHRRLQRALHAAGARVGAFFFCPHTPQDGCSCRKPAPGMLQQIASRYGAEPHEIWAIGQSSAHIQAGQALGAHVALVDVDMPLPPSITPCTDPQVPRYAGWLALAQALTQTAPPSSPRIT